MNDECNDDTDERQRMSKRRKKGRVSGCVVVFVVLLGCSAWTARAIDVDDAEGLALNERDRTRTRERTIQQQLDKEVDVAFGFPSQYNCFGRIFDEPRSMRLKCTKQSRRQLNCRCDEAAANSRAVRCECDPLIGDAESYEEEPPHMELVRKFVNMSTLYPTKIESGPGRPGGKHLLN